jgi:anti-anti-sigma factor
MLAIDFSEGGVVEIVGRLDAAEAPAAQAFLDATMGTVTMDCRSLEYISSAGLGVLLKTQKRLPFRWRKVAPHGRQPPPAGHLQVFRLRQDLRN